MKRIAFFVLIFPLVVNAGVIDIFITSINDQPISPTKQVFVQPIQDVVGISIVYNAPPGRFLLNLGSDISNEWGCYSSLIYLDQIRWPSGLWDTNFRSISLTPKNIVQVDAIAAGFDTIPGTGSSYIIVENISVRLTSCMGIFEIVDDINNPSVEINENYNMFYPDYGPGITIIGGVCQEPIESCLDCPGQPYGDTDGDGNVTIMDLSNLIKAYSTAYGGYPHGKETGQFNGCCDFNHDCLINIYDFAILAQNWLRDDLQTCENTWCW